ncbi:MAG TPA: BON domain-containing protein [Polyangia bacterium]
MPVYNQNADSEKQWEAAMKQRDRGGEVQDRAMRDDCQRALAADPALVSCAIRLGDDEEAARRQVLGTEGVEGRINVHVESAIVILEGEVPSLGHKRLAGVLAHRLPGCRGVANRVWVVHEQEDSDEELERSVRLAFSRNPVLFGSRIEVRVDNAVVTLEGGVASAGEARAAVRDAANVLGVARVEDRLFIDPIAARVARSAATFDGDERGRA